MTHSSIVPTPATQVQVTVGVGSLQEWRKGGRFKRDGGIYMLANEGAVVGAHEVSKATFVLMPFSSLWAV